MGPRGTSPKNLQTWVLFEFSSFSLDTRITNTTDITPSNRVPGRGNKERKQKFSLFYNINLARYLLSQEVPREVPPNSAEKTSPTSPDLARPPVTSPDLAGPRQTSRDLTRPRGTSPDLAGPRQTWQDGLSRKKKVYLI